MNTHHHKPWHEHQPSLHRAITASTGFRAPHLRPRHVYRCDSRLDHSSANANGARTGKIALHAAPCRSQFPVPPCSLKTHGAVPPVLEQRCAQQSRKTVFQSFPKSSYSSTRATGSSKCSRYQLSSSMESRISDKARWAESFWKLTATFGAQSDARIFKVLTSRLR